MSDTTHTPHDIRDMLARTWYPFFARFGNLRTVQLQAIPAIMAGQNVLVGSATASGKTEAVVAPLLERCTADYKLRGPRPSGTRVLVISPTRALCNDLLRRLQNPVHGADLTIDVKTGDSPLLDYSNPPDVLITTPESLDSMLARRPKFLQTVRGMMIDELHLLDSIARGDQLLCLLERLDRVTPEPLQRCAASATLPDAPALAQRFLGPDAVCVTVTNDEGTQRSIEATLVHHAEASPEDVIGQHFLEGRGRKILVFANARSQVEQIVGGLNQNPQLRGRVFAHHGSLSKNERLRSEQNFFMAPSAICVATMTLELGVDIGDVDRVVLVGPPPDVSSLLQRVGRSNRRESTTHLTCIYNNAFNRARFIHLLGCASRGELFEDSIKFRPSVIAQQALSLVFQNPKNFVTAEAIHERLPPEARAAWTVPDCEAILKQMRANDFFHASASGRYVADEEAHKLFTLGYIHSNIEDNPELETYDETTGKHLGSIRLTRDQQDSLREGHDINTQLAGRAQKVLRIREGRVIVEGKDGTDEVHFFPNQAPRYSFGLARSLAESIGYTPNTIRIEPTNNKHVWRLGHFFGTLWGQLLGHVIIAQGRSADTGGPFVCTVNKRIEAGSAPFGSADQIRLILEDSIPNDRKILTRRLGAGSFARHVPQHLIDAWLFDCLQPDAFAQMLAGIELVHDAVHPYLQDWE